MQDKKLSLVKSIKNTKIEEEKVDVPLESLQILARIIAKLWVSKMEKTND